MGGKIKENVILKWPLNNNKNSTKNKKEDKKKWIHSSDTLSTGHVAYLVKFLGSTEVDKPKGIEVVKDGIRKLKFSQQLKKAEGTKTPKVELTISVDGVAIQEPKTKAIQHQYPLHRISYCADDKAEKRFFSFIAKEDESDKHTCFVFVSDKLAEEITLTIGQAFDLAYQRYMNGQSQEGAPNSLEQVNTILKDRLKDLASVLTNAQLNDFLNKHNISDVCQMSPIPSVDSNSDNVKSMSIDTSQEMSSEHSMDQLINLDAPVDNFTVDDINDADFDPRAGDSDSSDDFNSRFNNVQINNTPVQNVNTPQQMVGITPPPSFPPPNFNSVVTPHSAPVKQMFAAQPPPAIPPRESKNPFAAGFGGNQDPFGMSTFNASEQGKVDIFADLDPLKK